MFPSKSITPEPLRPQMVHKRHKERMNYDVFRVFYGSFVNKITRDSPVDSKMCLFDVGTRIGERLVDDFFLNIRPKRNMELQEVVESITGSFFPHYFSFHPDHNQNMVFLGKLPILHHFKTDAEYLEVLRGILHSVYNYLSRDKVRFEIASDQGEFKMFVRTGSKKAEMIVTGFSALAGSGP